MLLEKLNEVMYLTVNVMELFRWMVWKRNSDIWAQVGKLQGASHREKTVSGTKPHGENEFSVLANIRTSRTVGAGSWRGVRGRIFLQFIDLAENWDFFWVDGKSPVSPVQMSDVIWPTTIPTARLGCSVVSSAGGGREATTVEAGWTHEGRKSMAFHEMMAMTCFRAVLWNEILSFIPLCKWGN